MDMMDPLEAAGPRLMAIATPHAVHAKVSRHAKSHRQRSNSAVPYTATHTLMDLTSSGTSAALAAAALAVAALAAAIATAADSHCKRPGGDKGNGGAVPTPVELAASVC